ncbi:uncharacterized protein RJT20DRAFT_132113 [Scheffersomyces xylosifermentans]|uniref:uncharacterized protein n=1 Tax=Scheffersomyces xylosifermentans TaxID=1304137 RepID=UPI00315DEFB1
MSILGRAIDMSLAGRGYDSINDSSVSGKRRPQSTRSISSSNNGNSSHLADVDDEISVKEDSLPRLSFLDKINILKFTSITLENKGSVARDHMANERTFLAWLRTSLSFITIGIGVTQLFRIEEKSSKVKIHNTVLQLTPPDLHGRPIAKYNHFGIWSDKILQSAADVDKELLSGISVISIKLDNSDISGDSSHICYGNTDVYLVEYTVNNICRVSKP